MLLHYHSCLLVMCRLKAVIVFALDALHVHLERLFVVFGMLIAIGCLLVQVLSLISPVRLRIHEVAEEASFHHGICLST